MGISSITMLAGLVFAQSVSAADACRIRQLSVVPPLT